MSDSLRDQLLKAGFDAPKDDRKTKRKKSSKSASSSARKTTAKQATESKQTPDADEIARRKKVKAEIKVLIEENNLKDTSGELAYSFVVGKKVRQLFVNKGTHEKLSNGTAVITRLNGSTHAIPSTLVDPILQLNPDWVIIRNEKPSNNDTSADDYADFQIPDDLMW